MSRAPLRGFEPQRLAEARVAAGMTRADLARDTRVGEETVRRWELGLSDPQIDLLTAVIHRLGIDVSQVVVTDPATRMLTDWRYQRLMTRPQLAEHARMTVTLLGRVERGEAELTRERESQLAKALRISKAQVRRAYLLARTRGPGTFA